MNYNSHVQSISFVYVVYIYRNVKKEEKYEHYQLLFIAVFFVSSMFSPISQRFCCFPFRLSLDRFSFLFFFQFEKERKRERKNTSPFPPTLFHARNQAKEGTTSTSKSSQCHYLKRSEVSY